MADEREDYPSEPDLICLYREITGVSEESARSVVMLIELVQLRAHTPSNENEKKEERRGSGDRS